jgi:hypothetical protein
VRLKAPPCADQSTAHGCITSPHLHAITLQCLTTTSPIHHESHAGHDCIITVFLLSPTTSPSAHHRTAARIAWPITATISDYSTIKLQARYNHVELLSTTANADTAPTGFPRRLGLGRLASDTTTAPLSLACARTQHQIARTTPDRGAACSAQLLAASGCARGDGACNAQSGSHRRAAGTPTKTALAGLL